MHASNPTSTVDYIHVLRPQITVVDDKGKFCNGAISDHCAMFGMYR